MPLLTRPPFRPRPDPSAKAVPAEEEEQGGAALVELEVPACFIPRHLKEEQNVNVALDSTRGRGRRRVSPADARVHSQTQVLTAELLTAVNDVCVEPLARCVCIVPSRWRVGLALPAAPVLISNGSGFMAPGGFRRFK